MRRSDEPDRRSVYAGVPDRHTAASLVSLWRSKAILVELVGKPELPRHYPIALYAASATLAAVSWRRHTGSEDIH
jgi:hypothetical protein